ncbi:hypothetical protein BpJC7_00060 [Weizmannia acidilactici]|uniref:Polysaccharide biosynthesis protein n=1 Tax=Weizmannia acidilactici TaxID=2607726 RepID=A0A5J4JA27_9BACI|nr:oligosaccharide flippase family protein [Weizmannia acidilactici]GER68703.1 hypothetical protein BpJC7_00060 [Weizmannia acidilactici]
MKPFMKKLFGFSIGPVGGAFISFITIPVTTHFVSPAEYGKASMFILFQTLIGTFLYLGVDQAYTREYHEADNKADLFRNALLIPLGLAAAVCAVIVLDSHFVSRVLFGEGRYVLASALFGIMIVFMVLERFILLSIRMKERAFEYSFFNLLIKAVLLVATLVFVLFIRRDFLAVLYSTVVGQILGDLYLIIRYRRYFLVKHFRPDKRLAARLLKFGLPLAVAASVTSLLNSFGRLSLRAWSSYEEIGIYAATLKIAALLSIVQTSFTNFWVPTAYRWFNEKRRMVYFKLVSEGVLLVMSWLFFTILTCKRLVVLLLSPGYADAAYLIGFLCLQPVLYTVSETTTLGIVFSKKSYLNIWVSFISIAPCLLLSVLLIPHFGAVGAAVSTGVSYVFFFWGRSFFSEKNWEGFPLRKHFWVTAVMFLAALANAFPLKGIELLNIALFLAVSGIQMPAIKNIWNMFRAKQLNLEKS